MFKTYICKISQVHQSIGAFGFVLYRVYVPTSWTPGRKGWEATIHMSRAHRWHRICCYSKAQLTTYIQLEMQWNQVNILYNHRFSPDTYFFHGFKSVLQRCRRYERWAEDRLLNSVGLLFSGGGKTDYLLHLPNIYTQAVYMNVFRVTCRTLLCCCFIQRVHHLSIITQNSNTSDFCHILIMGAGRCLTTKQDFRLQHWEVETPVIGHYSTTVASIVLPPLSQDLSYSSPQIIDQSQARKAFISKMQPPWKPVTVPFSKPTSLLLWENTKLHVNYR